MTGLGRLKYICGGQATEWLMNWKERVLVVSLAAMLRPKVTVELGIWKGGCSQHLAEYSEELWCVDMLSGIEGLPEKAKVFTGTTNDFFSMNPDVKADLIVVDAGHSENDAYNDMSNSIKHGGVIIAHDSVVSFTRRGYWRAVQENFDKIYYHDLGFIPGTVNEFETHDEMWGGLGIVVMK